MTNAKPNNWTSYRLDHLKLSLDVFSDLSALKLRRDDKLTSLIQEVGPVQLILWAGHDQTLESWQQRLDVRDEAHFEPEEHIMVCDQAARKQTAIVTQAGAMGSFVEGDGTIGHLYEEASKRVHVCVSFTHEGRSILQCWIIDEDARSAHIADESRFFESLRCFD